MEILRRWKERNIPKEGDLYVKQSLYVNGERKGETNLTLLRSTGEEINDSYEFDYVVGGTFFEDGELTLLPYDEELDKHKYASRADLRFGYDSGDGRSIEVKVGYRKLKDLESVPDVKRMLEAAESSPNDRERVHSLLDLD